MMITNSRRRCAGLASHRIVVAWATLAVVATLGGCGGGAQPDVSSDEGQIRAALTLLGQEYGGYMASHNGQPPKDEASMRKHIEARLPELSESYNVKSVDMLLRNGRDGQPLSVIVGRKVEVPEFSSYPWAAYEKTGVDGKRLVSDTRGGVYEIDDAQFAEHVPGA